MIPDSLKNMGYTSLEMLKLNDDFIDKWKSLYHENPEDFLSFEDLLIQLGSRPDRGAAAVENTITMYAESIKNNNNTKGGRRKSRRTRRKSKRSKRTRRHRK